MVSKSYKITSDRGVHSKVAVILVDEATKYKSAISLRFKEKMVDLKSILGVMSLGIYGGEVITISCLGEDESLASGALNRIITELEIGKLTE